MRPRAWDEMARRLQETVLGSKLVLCCLMQGAFVAYRLVSKAALGNM